MPRRSSTNPTITTARRDPAGEYRIGLKASWKKTAGGPVIRGPEQVVDLFRWLVDEPREVVIGCYLNNRGMVMGWYPVSAGGIDSAPVDPRVLFAPALLIGAPQFIVVHNHPSGSPDPSAVDVRFAGRLADAAVILGLGFTDFVIVAKDGWRSLAGDPGHGHLFRRKAGDEPAGTSATSGTPTKPTRRPRGQDVN